MERLREMTKIQVGYWIIWFLCVCCTAVNGRMDFTNVVLLLVPAIVMFLYPKWRNTTTMESYFRPWTKFFVGLVSVYYSFALTGNNIFMH